MSLQSMPPEVVCLIFDWLTEIDLVNVILSDRNFDLTAGYILRNRDFRISSIAINGEAFRCCLTVYGSVRGDETFVPPPPEDVRECSMLKNDPCFKVMGTLIRKESVNSDSESDDGEAESSARKPVVQMNLYREAWVVPRPFKVQLPIVNREYSHSDEVSAEEQMTAVFHYLITHCNVSMAKITFPYSTGEMMKSLKQHFNEEKPTERIQIKHMEVSPESSLLLKWVIPQTLLFTGTSRELLQKEAEYKFLNAGIERLELFPIRSDNVDNLMRVYKLPYMELPEEAFWSEDSFRQVLTDHVNNRVGSRIIDCFVPDDDLFMDGDNWRSIEQWEELYASWLSLAGPKAFDRNGQPRITTELSQAQFGSNFKLFLR